MVESITFSLRSVVLAWIGLKLLLINSYRSTDFEVHRNWLAITNSLPMSRWYYESTSEWTLDYPPFFGLFELFLSQVARLFDPLMLVVDNLNYNSVATVLFQRLTVISGDLVLLYAAYQWGCHLSKTSLLAPKRSALITPIAVVLHSCNVGLLLVDNVHFQYNGVLYGILLLSALMLAKGEVFKAAWLFATLLNLKHIFIYVAPAYFVYLLREFCFCDNDDLSLWRRFRLGNLVKLGGIVIGTFAVSFGPFVYWGQLAQVISRLFPFKRGLTHAYWAPNFWSLYNFGDFLLAKCKGIEGQIPYTSGLVQDVDHLILPSVSPTVTLLLTAASILPFVTVVLAKGAKSPWTFMRLLALCAYGSFIWSWHVHEKAILMVVVPMALLSLHSSKDSAGFLLLSAIGNFSLFPLLFKSAEEPLKVPLALLYTSVAHWMLAKLHCPFHLSFSPFLSGLELSYLAGFLPLEAACWLLTAFLPRLTFAPLIVRSVYSAVGLIYCWLLAIWRFLSEELQVDQLLFKHCIWRRQQMQMRKSLVTQNVVEWQSQLNSKLKLVGGMDISTLDGDMDNGYACLVVLSYPDLKVVYSSCDPVELSQPYMPGYLAFREAPPLMTILTKLKRTRPDLLPQVLIIDGNGVLHPSGFGLACQIGVLSGIPTVGVAKNLHLVDGLLKGKRNYQEMTKVGDQLDLIGKSTGDVLGAAVKTSIEAKNPVFVSVGHQIDLPTAVQLVVKCSKHREPEPIRLADQLSREYVAKFR